MSWERYLEKENILKQALAIQYFGKLIGLFYKNHSDKPTASFEIINTTLLMAKSTIKPAAKTETPKQKQGQPVNSINK